MIKAEVNVSGIITRSAVVRTNKENNPYLSFMVAVNVHDAKTGSNRVDILVSVPGAPQPMLGDYAEGRRVSVAGSMDIRNKEGKLVFYLTAKDVKTDGVPDGDAISGTMDFRGHLKKENVFEEKKDKNGHAYLLFSGYSSEKVGDTFVSTWVTFMSFPEKGADISTVKSDSLRPQARVDIKGRLQVGSYNNAARLTCRVDSISDYTPF